MQEFQWKGEITSIWLFSLTKEGKKKNFLVMYYYLQWQEWIQEFCDRLFEFAKGGPVWPKFP